MLPVEQHLMPAFCIVVWGMFLSCRLRTFRSWRADLSSVEGRPLCRLSEVLISARCAQISRCIVSVCVLSAANILWVNPTRSNNLRLKVRCISADSCVSGRLMYANCRHPKAGTPLLSTHRRCNTHQVSTSCAHLSRPCNNLASSLYRATSSSCYEADSALVREIDSPFWMTVNVMYILIFKTNAFWSNSTGRELLQQKQSVNCFLEPKHKYYVPTL